MFPVLWLTAAIAFAGDDPVAQAPVDPAKLLAEVIGASKENSRRSINWLGQEDIRRYDLRRKRKRVSWVTYEASKVEGENYYRVVRRNGKPLPKEEARREQLKLERTAALRRSGEKKDRIPDNRFSMSLRHVIDHHELKYVGADTYGGRKIWIIDTRIYHVAPLPSGPGDIALAGDGTFWVDQETKLLLMQEIRVTREWERWNPGSLVRYELEWNGEVMLPRRILVRNETAASESEQLYSDYRKFGSDSTIRFDSSAADSKPLH
jgi:hypothetical protein